MQKITLQNEIGRIS